MTGTDDARAHSAAIRFLEQFLADRAAGNDRSLEDYQALFPTDRDVVAAEYARVASGAGHEPPVDGVALVQEYIAAPAPFITRAEFIGGRFLYAVRVDTSLGFELCPADACAVDHDANVGAAPRHRVRDRAGKQRIVNSFTR